MAKLIIEKDPSTKLTTELDDSICERLWRLEKEWWRGKRESVGSAVEGLLSEMRSEGYNRQAQEIGVVLKAYGLLEKGEAYGTNKAKS